MIIAENLQEQARDLLIKGKYNQLTSLYEQAITTEPEVVNYYWHLGLAYLLQEQEEAAQTTWLLAMAQGGDEETEQWAEELVQILDVEAQRQEQQLRDSQALEAQQALRNASRAIVDRRQQAREQEEALREEIHER